MVSPGLLAFQAPVIAAGYANAKRQWGSEAIRLEVSRLYGKASYVIRLAFQSPTQAVEDATISAMSILTVLGMLHLAAPGPQRLSIRKSTSATISKRALALTKTATR